MGETAEVDKLISMKPACNHSALKIHSQPSHGFCIMLGLGHGGIISTPQSGSARQQSDMVARCGSGDDPEVNEWWNDRLGSPKDGVLIFALHTLIIICLCWHEQRGAPLIRREIKPNKDGGGGVWLYCTNYNQTPAESNLHGSAYAHIQKS